MSTQADHLLQHFSAEKLERFICHVVTENAVYLTKLHDIRKQIDEETKANRKVLYSLMRHENCLTTEPVHINSTITNKTTTKKKDPQPSSAQQPPTKKPKLESSEPKKQASSGRSRGMTLEKVPRDEDGKPVLPLTFGAIKLLDLGTIDSTRTNYHTARHIFPIGFKTQRTFADIYHPDKRIPYTFTIEDGGSNPKFVVDAPTDPPFHEEKTSASQCHKAILEILNKTRSNDKASNAASGPDFFGLGHSVILQLLKELPGFELCKRFRRDASKKKKQKNQRENTTPTDSSSKGKESKAQSQITSETDTKNSAFSSAASNELKDLNGGISANLAEIPLTPVSEDEDGEPEARRSEKLVDEEEEDQSDPDPEEEDSDDPESHDEVERQTEDSTRQSDRASSKAFSDSDDSEIVDDDSEEELEDEPNTSALGMVNYNSANFDSEPGVQPAFPFHPHPQAQNLFTPYGAPTHGFPPPFPYVYMMPQSYQPFPNQQQE